MCTHVCTRAFEPLGSSHTDLCVCVLFLPVPASPLQYKQNPEMFKQTARLWAHVYAGAPVSSPEYTRKIDKLCAMGFDKVSGVRTPPPYTRTR